LPTNGSPLLRRQHCHWQIVCTKPSLIEYPCKIASHTPSGGFFDEGLGGLFIPRTAGNIGTDASQ